MQRGLAALKAVQRHTSPRGLALAATRRGLALARADAAPDSLRPVVRPGIIPDLVELHRLTGPCTATPYLIRERSSDIHHRSQLSNVLFRHPRESGGPGAQGGVPVALDPR